MGAIPHHRVGSSPFEKRWKALDEGGVKAKSRIVILGFKDPHVLQLERSAPTPTSEAFTCMLQVLASQRRAATSSDISNAFGQSAKTTRQQPLCASLPQNMLEAGFNLDPRQLLICETEVYGLISGPSWLRQSLVRDLEALGYRRNPYDKCIMTLATLIWFISTKIIYGISFQHTSSYMRHLLLVLQVLQTFVTSQSFYRYNQNNLHSY